MSRRALSIILYSILSVTLSIFLLPFENTAKAQSSDEFPSKVKLQVPLFGEQHNLSCEYASAHMITAYWGMELNENRFIANIDPSDNPHKGFRGDIDGYFGGINNYGIYAEPIAAYLNIKGFRTKLLAGGETALRRELALGRPLLVWITYELHNSYAQKVEVDGVPLTLVPWEHAVVVTGYDENGIYVNGPADGTRAFFDWKEFNRSWGYFNDMALSIWPASQPNRADETFGVSPLFYRAFLNHGDIEIFGLPISGEIQENGKTVQYFEQAKFEYDQKSQEITFGLLGRDATLFRTQETAFQPLKNSGASDFQFFPETGHSLGNEFLKFWQAHEGLQVFGMPISEVFLENGKTVQYFERVRLEFDPTTNSVRVSSLGRELMMIPVLNRILNSAFQYLKEVYHSPTS